MDILNFISWIKGNRVVNTVDASKTLIPVGLKDPKRDDGYIAGAISVADLLTSSGANWGSIGGNIYAQGDLQSQLSNKQDYLYSGNNIKTINGNSVLGSGDLSVGAGTLESNLADCTVWNNGKGNLQSNTTFGETSLKNNTSGAGNCAFGEATLLLNDLGSQNSAFGNNALRLNTTGTGNNAFGSNALGNNFTGTRNIAIGQNALINHNLGSYNIGIGYDITSGNFSDSIIIGNSATATGNNQLVIGSSSRNAGTIATEALTPTISWTVKINGTDYKIPLQLA